MGRHLHETMHLLRWRHATLVLSILAVLSAISAMCIPGPADEVTEIASILILGAMALASGHAWGLLVVACAEVMIVGKSLAIVTVSLPDVAASPAPVAALLFALPGIALFVATLPFMVEVIVGEKDTPVQRPMEVIASLVAAGWLAAPVVKMFA